MTRSPAAFEFRRDGQHLCSVGLSSCRFNPQLLLAVPFCAALTTLAVIGIRNGAQSGAMGILLLGLASAGAVLVLAWPIVSTLFGREVLTLDRERLTWHRQVGRFGVTRTVPLLAINAISVQHLGVMGLAPNDVGWCLAIATHQPHRSLIVGAGFMHDEKAMTSLADHLQTALASARATA